VCINLESEYSKWTFNSFINTLKNLNIQGAKLVFADYFVEQVQSPSIWIALCADNLGSILLAK
jgi:hypothetical protein